jgi:uncharacterized protein DUF4279/anti-sigma-K factor RsiG
MDPVSDPRSLGPEELKRLLNGLISREQEVSSTRQVLHAQIDALRRELVDRLRDEGSEVIFGPDVPGSGLSARCVLGVFSEWSRPDEITARVGVTPTRSRVAGELIRPGGPTVPKHMWLWEPSTDVPRELNAQLDAIWSAIAGRAPLFRELASNGVVEIAVVLEHYGRHLLLGWALDRRHIERAAELGANIDIDEYDYTEPD